MMVKSWNSSQPENGWINCYIVIQWNTTHQVNMNKSEVQVSWKTEYTDRWHTKIELWPPTCSHLPRKHPFSQSTAEEEPALSQICRKLDSFLECQSRRLHDNFSNNQPKMARTWLIMDSFLNFCPTFNLGSIKGNQICTPNQSRKSFQFWWVCLQQPHANSVQSGHIWSLPSFSTIKM